MVTLLLCLAFQETRYYSAMLVGAGFKQRRIQRIEVIEPTCVHKVCALLRFCVFVFDANFLNKTPSIVLSFLTLSLRKLLC